ncbi:MAG: ATP-binding protein [Trueperaceae bacterium]|nr:ATP-binding protein [Trueperaceae bacterium]
MAPKHHRDEQFGLETFPDPVLAVALLDRLLHDATTLSFRGESYRLQTRRDIGLPTPNAEANTTKTSDNDHYLLAESVQNDVAADTTVRRA